MVLQLSSQELPGPSLNCQKPAPGPSSCLQLDASAAQAPSKPHMKNTVQNSYNHGLEIIFRHIIPEKTTAHQLYSHSGYHIIQDPIKTSSTSIQLTCIFWPQYPTLPHKTSKILLVLSSSRRSLSFSPLSSADLPKWVKRGETWETSNSRKAPRSLRQKPGIEALGFMSKCWTNKRFWSFNVFYQKQKKHTHLHKSEIVVETYFFGPLFFFSEACFNAKPEILFRAPLQDLSHRPRVGGLLVTVTSHWPRYQRVTNRKLEDQQEMQQI